MALPVTLSTVVPISAILGSVEKVSGEAVGLDGACFVEQVAGVVEETEVSAVEVVPVLLARQELEGLSADLRVGVHHFIGMCDHHQ